MNRNVHVLWPVTLWAFVVIKAFGTSLVAWSWWWVLLPPVPTFWLAFTRLGWL